MPGSRQSLSFVAPRSVDLREEPLPTPHAGQVLVETLVSGISPGTEMLVYRGQVPAGMPLDSTIPDLAGAFAYPLKYGYAAVGRIVALGADVGRDWLGQLVVGFHPHESHFVASPSALLRVPPGVTAEAAAFLPNVETAVTLLMDGQPIVGERVALFGQGLVGLLCTAVLARFPLTELVTLDRHPLRRAWSMDLGADRCLDPAVPGEIERLSPSFDLTYELSGNPAVLDDAIGATGFDGRVVIGSWYGDQPATIALGGSFHRSRIRLISSQVSTIAPRWSGRWSKARRLGVAWRMLAEIEPTRLITHRFALCRAAEAYDLLDRRPGEAVAVLLTYEASCTSAS